jgi:methylenetetrahydrofolate reductase (NADPH)
MAVRNATSAVRRIASRYSVEVTPAASKQITDFSTVEGLRPGTTVNVTYLVGAQIEESVSTCERLARAGMNPVAHVPVRAFASLPEVGSYLEKLRSVGVNEVLVLGGGAAEPKGELHESMQLLESGLVQKHGFTRIGFAAHPEGHPDISAPDVTDALARKAKWAAAEGAELYYETQFCFEADPIIEWERRTRAQLVKQLGTNGTPLPRVRLGVAGPAKIANLIKFGMMSGVGNSLRFFTKYTGNVLMLATKAAPDGIIAGISRHADAEPDCLIEGLHYYPFGGFVSTLRWANAVEQGDFSMDANETGFTANA